MWATDQNREAMAMLTPFSCSGCEIIHGLNFQAQTMAENTEASEELVNSQFPQLDQNDLQKLGSFATRQSACTNSGPGFTRSSTSHCLAIVR